MLGVAPQRMLEYAKLVVPEQLRVAFATKFVQSRKLRRLLEDLRRNPAEEKLITSELARPPVWGGLVDASRSIGMTERVVEIPWVLSRLRGEASVLDIGTSFAPRIYVSHLLGLHIPHVRGLDIAPAPDTGMPLVAGDIRAAPFKDDSFDLVLCISTLEHIGLDRDPFSGGLGRGEEGDATALREIRRILRPKGRLLVSVPFGRPERHPEFRQYGLREWEDLIERSGFVESAGDVFAYTRVGWRRASPADVDNRGSCLSG